MPNYPVDKYDRPITNLRFSLTQDCNFNCIYCHSEGEEESSEKITKEDVEKIVEIGVENNIRKVKLTGGEPLVRDDLVKIVESISPHLDDLSLTTNGYLLEEKLDKLVKAGLDRANISLDSLDPETFEKITGRDLEKVMDGIEKAIESPLYPIKINTVILDGLNNDEIEDFIEFTKEKDIILQFIEFHDTNTLVNGEGYFEKYHYSLDQLEEKLEGRAEETETRRMHHRKKYFFDGAEIELVKPMHNTEFCGNCTRLRITSNREYKPCLMRNDLNIPFEKYGYKEGFKKAILNREPYFN